MKNSDSQDQGNNVKSNYNTIFKGFCRHDHQNIGNMQLIAFVAQYKVTDTIDRGQLIEKICNLIPSPHNIFQAEEGYLCRFELDINVPVETEEQEEALEITARKFVEHNSELKGEFQYLEIGRWEHPQGQYLFDGGYSNE